MPGLPTLSRRLLEWSLAPIVGSALVWGGYWIPPVELAVASSVPALGALTILFVNTGRRDDSPNLCRRLAAFAVLATAWLLFASTPYLIRSYLLQREAASLPAWNRERPAFRFWVVANNQEDYHGTQVARDPLAVVDAFYVSGMSERGWRLEMRREAYGLRYLIFAKGHRKIAYHLGPAWNGRATTVEIFRVSFWRGADDPGSGRRAWYRWVHRLRQPFRE
jgi:hypothetical protein